MGWAGVPELPSAPVSATRNDTSPAAVSSPGSAPADADGRGARPDERATPELVVLAVGAVVAGVVLRFVAPSPLWLDEALSVNIARLPIGEIPEALRHDGHPPLYYVVLHLWMGLVGESDSAVRALSGLCSVAALPLAWIAGRRRGGPVLGLVALTVLAGSPFVLRYATETRMYALVMFLVLAGYLVADDLTRRGRDGWGRVLLLALIVAGLLWSHYWAMWLVGAAFLVFAWGWRRAADPAVRRGSGRALVAVVAGGVLLLPWLPSLLYQGRHTGTPWAGPVRPTSLLAQTFTDLGGGDFKDAQFVGTMLVVLVLLAVFGAALDRRRIELDLRTNPQLRVEAVVVALTIVLGLAVGYVTWSAFATRYTAVFVPLVLLLAAAGVTRFEGRWIRAGVLTALLVVSGLGAVYNVRTTRTQAGVIAASVGERAEPGDVVVYCPDQLGPSSQRLLPAGLDQVVYPDLTSPERVDWVDYNDRLAGADPAAVAGEVLARAGAHDVFLIWSPSYKTHVGTCEALNAALQAARPGQLLVAENGDDYYEHANLSWFPAP